jgi:hypothetical protein
MPRDPGPDGARLLSASAQELLEILGEDRERLTEEHLLFILKNNNLTAEAVRAILAHPPFLTAYGVKKALVFGRSTPTVDAIRLLNHLYWTDLLEASCEMRLHPLVRRSAERRLVQRLPEMGLGERVTMARRGSRGLVMAMRTDEEPRVFTALLQNRFLTEDVVLAAAGNKRTPPEILGMIHYNPKWGVRYEVKMALVLNPSTPQHLAQFIVRKLRFTDVADLAGNKYLRPAVRRACQSVLDRREIK